MCFLTSINRFELDQNFIHGLDKLCRKIAPAYKTRFKVKKGCCTKEKKKIYIYI